VKLRAHSILYIKLLFWWQEVFWWMYCSNL